MSRHFRTYQVSLRQQIAWAQVERVQILGHYAAILPKCPPDKLYARS